MRPILLALAAVLLLPSAASAQSAEYTYNTYMRDIKKYADAGWSELQSADESPNQEERCRHASAAVYNYRQAAITSETMARVLSHSGGDYYNEAVEVRDAALGLAQDVETMYEEKCG